SAARRPTATAPVSTAASPRLETSTRGGYGSHSASSERIGSRRRSPFVPSPPPSTTSATSATAAIGATWAATRRATSATTSPARDPLPALAEGGEVDVVVDGHGHLEELAELGDERALLEARHVQRQRDSLGRGLDDARHADDAAVDHVGRLPGRLEQRRGERAHRRERYLGARVAELDVLPREDLAA